MVPVTPKFVDQQDVRDMASLLMQLNDIPSGRQIVWLLNDCQSADNQQAIERWLLSEVWRRQVNKEQVDLPSLSSSLQDCLDTALWEASI